jgi:hypothetical protein
MVKIPTLSDLTPGLPIRVVATLNMKAYHATVRGPGPDPEHISVRHGTRGGQYLARVLDCRLLLKPKVRKRKVAA